MSGDAITIKGPESGKSVSGRYQAVVTSKGTGGYVVAISHSNYVLDGFTIDGQEALAGTTFPTTVAAMNTLRTSANRSGCRR